MPQSPEQLQRQIEETRAELASTVEQIAERLNPKAIGDQVKAEARGKAQQLYGKTFAREVTQDGGDGQYVVTRTVRWERVGAVGGGLVLLLLVRRRRKARAKTAKQRHAREQALAAAQRAAAQRERAQKAAAKGKELSARAAKRAQRSRLELQDALEQVQRALEAARH